jgi:hypothetical protein
MLVLLLILVSAVLLGHGALTESTGEVAASGVVAVIGALVAAAPRVLGRLREQAPDDDETTEPVEPDSVVAPDPPEPDAATPHSLRNEDSLPVVFVAGRTTFHSRDCQSVVGKVTSSALRADLERGGMTSCRRCLSVSNTP